MARRTENSQESQDSIKGGELLQNLCWQRLCTASNNASAVGLVRLTADTVVLKRLPTSKHFFGISGILHCILVWSLSKLGALQSPFEF